MLKTTMTRRSFFKLAAATAALSAVTVAEGMQAFAEEPATTAASDGGVKVLRTACRGCGKMECGVWVTVRNGRAIRIEGDDTAWGSNGNCCPKSQASIQCAYHPDRITYPMIRTNPRAEIPEWKRVTWDEALNAVEKGMMQIVDKYSGWSIMGLQGTSRMWANLSGSRGVPDLYRVVNMVGAAQICKGPRRVAGCCTLQNGVFWVSLVDYPKCYVQWGTDQSQSNYDDACRTVTEVVQRSKYFISIDPRQCNSGKEADYWLPLRTGSDHALAYGWTHIVMDRELYDDYLVKYWSNAPFLINEDLEGSGWIGYACDTSKPSDFPMKTKLLKESDLVEGGDVHKFAVWNNATNSITYFDADDTKPHGGCWEMQESYEVPTTGWEYEYGGFVVDYAKMPENLDPALWCDDGYELTLKDGRKMKFKTVWQKYWDECVSEWTLEKTAETCDLDPKLIEEACLTWATRIDPRCGSGGLNAALAPEQVGRAIQTFHTIYFLSFMTDNYDTPGGNRGMTRSAVSSAYIPFTPKSTPKSNLVKRAQMCGVEEFPLTHWYSSFTDARCVWDAAHTGSPYPIKGCFCISGDVMNQCNANYGWEGLLQMDFMVTLDLWHMPTSQLSDVLLPICHWLEVPGWFRTSQGASGHVGLHQHCIDAPGEALYEALISQKIYKIHGMPFFNPETGDAWDRDYKECLDADAKKSGLGKDWEDVCANFQKHGWWSCKELYPGDWGSYRRFLIGFARTPSGSNSKCATAGASDGKPGLPLPTMKMELWSTVKESIVCNKGGKHVHQELPYFKEPPVSPISTPDLYKDYPFNMTTGRRIPVYFHNEHRQLPWCREVWPAPRIEINPADAVKLGVDQGEWVWIESPWGKIRQIVDLYHGIKPGTINCEHQWWFPECEDIYKGFNMCSVNCLVNREAQDPMCGASQLRAYCVKVYKATPENCPNGKVVPTDETGIEIIHDASDPRLKLWVPTYEGRA
ncbi:MAG: molybdopterin-dependent oxidoreductase [Coriobacteriales bacterium]|nr:molybdopterin-dependent oxidoreductase [Coriobacteriales bacterium]